jgi:FAD/FMN-containing dehydrogenase
VADRALSRRLRIALGVVLLLLVVAGPPALYLLRTWTSDAPVEEPLPPGMIDDQSRLELTTVADVIQSADTADASIPILRAALARARTEGLKVSIGGARHSMGGQTIAPDGLFIDMTPLASMTLLDDHILRVGSGAIWRDVVPFLDARGRSPAVMQSDNDFSVGGSVSVGAHGWQTWRPPIGATVKAMRVMTPDGQVQWCSRSKHTALFRHVLGGYGLFGIILELDLETAPNARYRIEAREAPLAEIVAEFPARGRHDPAIGMSYARLDIRKGSLFDTGLITHFKIEPTPADGLPAARAPGLAGLRRAVFRGSVGSDYGKRLRWNMERVNLLAANGKATTRNTQLSDTSQVVIGYERHYTDILHEYFVPPENAALFLAAVEALVAEHEPDLLNITVRDVRRDEDAVLRYAPTDVTAFVMLFHQARTQEGETAMREFTRDVIDAALANGGRHYLPYRLHATPEQLRRAYPMWDAFVAEKRRRDPDELLVNRLWLTYAD